LKAEIDSALQHGEVAVTSPEPPMAGFVGRLARYMLQVAIESEATAFLGREHYRRGGRQRAGWRNGYEPKHVQTEAGLLELAMPQLRGTEEPFQPRVAARLQTRTADLESLVRGMYVRGLSTQDVSALFADTFGGSRLSKSTVSRVTQQLNQDFDTWRRRDLGELPIVYLFLDGQYHAARQGTDERRACFPPMRSWRMAGPCSCTSIWARGNPMTRGLGFCRTSWPAASAICCSWCWTARQDW
jgi:transposase-like protein